MLTKEKAMKLFYVETFQFWPQPADWVGWPLSYLCNFQLLPRSTVTSFLKIEKRQFGTNIHYEGPRRALHSLTLIAIDVMTTVKCISNKCKILRVAFSFRV